MWRHPQLRRQRSPCRPTALRSGRELCTCLWIQHLACTKLTRATCNAQSRLQGTAGSCPNRRARAPLVTSPATASAASGSDSIANVIWALAATSAALLTTWGWQYTCRKGLCGESGSAGNLSRCLLPRPCLAHVLRSAGFEATRRLHSKASCSKKHHLGAAESASGSSCCAAPQPPPP